MTHVFHYPGSLTTPECNEVVDWMVTTDIRPISDIQLEYFTQRWAMNNTFSAGKGNNRVTMPLYDRKILHNWVEASLLSSSDSSSELSTGTNTNTTADIDVVDTTVAQRPAIIVAAILLGLFVCAGIISWCRRDHHTRKQAPIAAQPRNQPSKSAIRGSDGGNEPK